MRDTLINFLNSIKDYEHEAGKRVYDDERESEEFVDIYLKDKVKNDSRLDDVSDSMPIVEHLGKTYKPKIAYYGTEWEAWYESEGIRIPQDVLYNKYGSNLIETITALVNEIKSKGLYCYS